jgi:glycosyltransferase involved in cell wall biosynthesis
MKTVLHICSDYANQSIYNNFVTSLDEREIKQIVYVPVRDEVQINKNLNPNLQNASFHFKKILTRIDRFLFKRKINKTLIDISKTIDINSKNIDIIHAHFLFSDGGVAYELFKKTGVPYVVSVRNTDLNIFFKYFFFLRSFGINVLLNAHKVIFISPAYKETLLNTYIPRHLNDIISRKSEIIPNGVDDFWVTNAKTKQISKKSEFSFIYVGDFSKNKNIENSIKAFQILINKGFKIQFNIVGGGGNNEARIKEIVKSRDWITLFPRVTEKKVLLEHYNNNDFFIMPSIFETFGVTYIEALSQGLPVVFSNGQGIDGFFEKDTIGVSVDPLNYKSLAIKIEDLIKNNSIKNINGLDIVDRFSWKNISLTYKHLYEGK